MATASAVLARIDTVRFWPLPRPRRGDGRLRRTGIEIEFAGLSAEAAADVVRRLWGGRVAARGARDLVVRDGRLGRVTVGRDTALASTGAEGLLLQALGDLVPVEIVTAPLAPRHLPEADRLVRRLRASGARGSRDALGFGFGVHLNPEVSAPDAAFVLPVVRAFALLEDWLRAADPPDPTRRLLPFVDPWPRTLVDALAAEGADWDLAALADAYLALSPTRNRGLDLLPLLQHLEPARVRAALPPSRRKGGRPAFHFRLPEARIDEPGWSIAYEWNRWVLIERVAVQPALLSALAAAWGTHRRGLVALRADWARQVEAMLAEAPIWPD